MKKATSCEAAPNTAANIQNNSQFIGIQPLKKHCGGLFLATIVSESLHKEHTLPTWGLPKGLLAIASEVAEGYQCSLDFAITAMISAAATAMGKSAVLFWGNYVNYPNLWCVLVGHTTDHKTHCMKWLMKSIREYDKRLGNEYQQALSEYKDNGERGRKPYRKRILVDDFTPEKLYESLSENTRGMCLFRDELKGAFDDVGRYNSSGFVSHLLSIYDNTSFSAIRKTQEDVDVEEPLLNILGGIQPDKLSQAFQKPDFRGNGLFQRFLWTWPEPKSKPTEYVENNIDKNTEANWKENIEALFRLPKTEYRLDDEASKLYLAYCNKTETLGFGVRDDSEKSGIYGKLRINALRFALTVAVLNMHGKSVVTEQDMRYSIECMDYFEHCALKVYDLIKHPGKNMTKADAIRILAGDDGKGIKNQTQFAESIGVKQPYISHILKK